MLIIPSLAFSDPLVDQNFFLDFKSLRAANDNFLARFSRKEIDIINMQNPLFLVHGTRLLIPNFNLIKGG